MAGLLAWAADVVGAQTNGAEDEDLDLEDERVLASIRTPDQLRYAQELERRSVNLKRSIQDLRLRIPPPSIAQRLPDLHAHSLASNAALALQLNAHSTTREQAQLREVTLQEENIGYERTISNCQKKIQEKLQEATLLQNKLKELDITEERLRRELENAQSTLAASQSDELVVPKIMEKDISEGEHPTHGKPEELEKKKRELSSMEALVKDLEDKWTLVQQDSLKQPSAAQREKTLEKQLHSLIEQLTAKQAQAEGLASEIQAKQQN
ncbi:hypothetical protein QJS10_CPA08g01697 [Acorus calamus]|uniref:Uncharacterized protein n=1 Tax=Acorus calamus TaxID=4465 RepID=A0AAV9EBK3_ACOCL|nr:hypothetical protein QJS10_CPA08g01697 [Acorus calamus]